MKIHKLKEELKVLATPRREQISGLIAFRPKGFNQARTHTPKPRSLPVAKTRRAAV